jgi:signal transduction histidine kinase
MNYLDLLPDDLIEKINKHLIEAEINERRKARKRRKKIQKEKKRIAQELHDGVLGRLFGARLNLDSLNRFTDEEAIANRFNYLNELKNIEQDIREISHDLNREKYVLINNFVAIVNNLVEEQKNAFSPVVTCTIDEKIKWDQIANTMKINLYRMLQESLQNCNKYANASKIDILFELKEDWIYFSVADNGIGFDVKSKKKGIGLQNMISRTTECNGQLDVSSQKGSGTTIQIKLPLFEQKADH